jgi:hypothetical protein
VSDLSVEQIKALTESAALLLFIFGLTVVLAIAAWRS